MQNDILIKTFRDPLFGLTRDQYIEKLKKTNNKKSIEDFEKELSLFEKNQLGQLRNNVIPKNSQLKRAEE